MTDRLLTTREAAEYLGVGTTSIKRWADEAVLACERTAGGHRRFRSTELERFRRGQTPHEYGERPLSDLSGVELDALPYGVVQLDDSGKVLFYNATESAFSGLASREVLRRNFFTDVAPCTYNRLVRERFRDGIADGRFDFELDYTFTFRMRPTPVRLRCYREVDSATNWFLVQSRLPVGQLGPS